MKISNVSMAQSQSFKAKTVINAPEFLLDKADKLQLEHMGSKIGNKNDSIEITISSLHSDPKKPEVLNYNCLQKFNINSKKLKLNDELCFSVPYIEDGELNKQASPKVFIGKIFEAIQASK